jgi:hypothetical protein
VYGGWPPPVGNWDCSSFVTYVLGHDLGMALPGGKYGDPGFPPNAHGPVVLDYAQWSGAVSVRSASRGDLCIWQGAGPNGHIGIALGPNQMVSALDPEQGVAVTPIQGVGPAGAPLIYRQVTAAGHPGKIAAASSSGSLSGLVPALVGAGVLTLALVGGAAVLIVAAWPALTGGAGLAAGWAYRRATS